MTGSEGWVNWILSDEGIYYLKIVLAYLESVLQNYPKIFYHDKLGIIWCFVFKQTLVKQVKLLY